MSFRLATFFAALFLLPLALADDGYVATSGAALNYGHSKQIQMVSERVVVKLGERQSWIDATFHFKNLAGPVTVTMGFPEDSDRDRQSLHDFRSEVDGSPVAIHRKFLKGGVQDEEHKAVWIKKVRFGKDQDRIVHVAYRSDNGYLYNGTMWHDYILTTGATWAGKIQKCELVLDTTHADAYAPIVPLLPAEGKKEDPIAKWHSVRSGVESTVLTNIKPYFNFRVLQTGGFWKFKINGKVVPIEYGEDSNPVWPRLLDGKVWVSANTCAAIFAGHANPKGYQWGNPDVPVSHTDEDPSNWPPGIIRVPGRQELKLPYKNIWLHEGRENQNVDMIELRDVVKALGAACSFDKRTGYVLINFPRSAHVKR